MAQPEFVPVPDIDDVRAGDRLPPAERWLADRPGRRRRRRPAARGDGFGNQGPDQGYALFLAKRFDDKLELDRRRAPRRRRGRVPGGGHQACVDLRARPGHLRLGSCLHGVGLPRWRAHAS